MAIERRLARLRGLWTALWADGRGWVLLTVSAGWALTIGVRIVYPALLPAIRTEFGFGYTTAGILVGLVWAAYGALQLPGGVLADTSSHRTALVVGTVITAVGIVAVVAAPLFGLLVFATVIMGAGTGIYGPSRVAVLSNTYPDHGSTAIGVSQAAGNLGNAIFPVIAGAVAVVAGWRAGLGYLVLGLAISALALWIAVPVPSQTGFARPTIQHLLGQTRSALLSRPVYYGTGLLLLLMFVYQSLTGFLPTYFIDEKGLAPETAATLFGGFFGAAVVFQLAAGPLADRFGIQRIVALFAAGSLPGFFLVLLADGLGVLVVGTLFLSSLLGCFPPAHAYTVGVVPTAIQGTGYGAIRTVYIGCGAAGPVLTGVLAEFVSFQIAVGTLGILVAGIVLVGWLLPIGSEE